MRYFVFILFILFILAVSALAHAESPCTEQDKQTMKRLAAVVSFSDLTDDQLDTMYAKGEICFKQIAAQSHKKNEMKMAKKDLVDLLNIEIVSDHTLSEKYSRTFKCPSTAAPVSLASTTSP